MNHGGLFPKLAWRQRLGRGLFFRPFSLLAQHDEKQDEEPCDQWKNGKEDPQRKLARCRRLDGEAIRESECGTLVADREVPGTWFSIGSDADVDTHHSETYQRELVNSDARAESNRLGSNKICPTDYDGQDLALAAALGLYRRYGGSGSLHREPVRQNGSPHRRCDNDIPGSQTGVGINSDVNS